jgi:hypothetical protein
MIRSILFSLFALVTSLSLFGQDWERQKVDVRAALTVESEMSLPLDPGVHPHVSYFLEARAMDMEGLQWRQSGAVNWQPIPIDEHVSAPGRYFSTLQFVPRGERDTLFIRSIGALTEAVFFHRFYPGSPAGEGSADLRDEDCECPRPEMEDRSDWCPTCPDNPAPFIHEPTHLIVHHSAGANSSQNWPAVVRSIWDFHVNGRGWDDIGYNFLVDPNGQIYVGRGSDVRGAHFCTTNDKALGVCILGTFTHTLPTSAARDAWLALSAWTSCDWEISPLERSLHRSSALELLGVSGHRDGCATECPGQTLYEALPDWREVLRGRMDACGLGEDSLLLSAESTPFPYTVDLNWSGGEEELSEYRLKIRELNSGIFGGWQLTFSDDKISHRLGLRAGEDYEFVVEAWNGEGRLQVSNTVPWSTEKWASEAAAMSLSPNPVVGDQIEWVWTDPYRGDVQLAWINMAGQVHPLGSWTKSRDTFLLTLSRAQLPAGRYLLRVSYDGNEIYLPLIIL